MFGQNDKFPDQTLGKLHMVQGLGFRVGGFKEYVLQRRSSYIYVWVWMVCLFPIDNSKCNGQLKFGRSNNSHNNSLMQFVMCYWNPVQCDHSFKSFMFEMVNPVGLVLKSHLLLCFEILKHMKETKFVKSHLLCLEILKHTREARL